MYSKQVCTNCCYEFGINDKPEFEYILNNTNSIILCLKCAQPLNEFFLAIKNRALRADSIFQAMNQDIDKCTICKKPNSHKHYFRKKEKRHIVLCEDCNKLIEIYLNAVLEQKGKLRDFSTYTTKLTALIGDLIK